MSTAHVRSGAETHDSSSQEPGMVARAVSAISVESTQAAAEESQLSLEQVAEVDAREDALMTAYSPDGTPPEHWLKKAEWKWFRYLMVVLAIGAAIWIAVAGVSHDTVLMGAALLVAMVFAAAPVWGSAILRAREGRAARAEAIAEIQSIRNDGTRDVHPGDRHFKNVPEIQIICVKEESHV